MMLRKMHSTNSRQKLTTEALEPRHLLSAVPFSEPTEIGPDHIPSLISDTRLNDLDADGDLDILLRNMANRGIGRGMSWYLNNGDGTFGPMQQEPRDISADLRGQDPFVADVDGDGDDDVIRSTSSIYWTENRVSEDGSFSSELQVINLTSKIRDVADFNSDGLDDLLTSTGWAENVGGGSFEEHRLNGFLDVHHSIIVDLDADGDLDVINEVGRAQPKLMFLENVGGDAVFAEAVTLGPDVVPANRSDFLPYDVDRDGDLDLIAIRPQAVDDGQFSWSSLLWMENTNGDFEFSVLRSFPDSQPPYPVAIYLQFDATGDGQPDLIFENQSGGYGRFDDLADSPWIEVDIPEFHHTATGDVDGDGDTDWLGTSFIGDVGWFDDVASPVEQVVAEGASTRLADLTQTDFDNDGDVDLVYRFGNQLSWFEHLGDATFAPQATILEASGSPLVLDLSGDGLPDVAYSARDDAGTLVHFWHRNLGEGALGEAISLASTIPIKFLDIDGDGDWDTRTLSRFQNVVLLNDGSGNFDDEVRVPVGDLTATDVDGDGDLDLVSSTWDSLKWFENTGGLVYDQGSEIASDENGQSIFKTLVTDLDGDGDADIVAIRESNVFTGDQFSQVYENRDGEFLLADEFEGSLTLPFAAVHAVDLDGDGDQDLVGQGFTGWDYFENLNGLQFEKSRKLPNTANLLELVPADINGDGRLDVAGILGDRIVWLSNELDSETPPITHVEVDALFAAIRAGSTDSEHDWNEDGSVNQDDVDYLLQEVLSTRRGDLNLDGRVDFADFLQLSRQFGKSDAGWSDGDLDGDEQVGFGDFLLLASVFGYRS